MTKKKIIISIISVIGLSILIFIGILIYQYIRISNGCGIEKCKIAALIRNSTNENCVNEYFYSNGGDILYFDSEININEDSNETYAAKFYCIPFEEGHLSYIAKVNNDSVKYYYVIGYYDSFEYDDVVLLSDETPLLTKLNYASYDILNNYYHKKGNYENVLVIPERDYDSLLIKLLTINEQAEYEKKEIFFN